MQSQTLHAICLIDSKDNTGVSGVVRFTQNGDKTTITATVKGLKKGKHGIHVHQYGDLTEGCKTAGPHFNPAGRTHGGPADEERHVGDLGNIESDGVNDSTFELVDHLVSLSGPNSVVGRSVVVHADEDDLGRGGFDDSKTTGHAGYYFSKGLLF